VDKLLDLFVEYNKKYKELFSLVYTALGGLVGIILYRERKKYKEGTDAARVAENEKRIKVIGDKVEELEDKISSITANVQSCQSARPQLMAPIEARINEMEKRLIFMLESNRETAKREKEHEVAMLMKEIERMVK